METKDRKNVVVGMLLAAICIMSVGYAALAQQLTISGTAQITSTWDVKITNIEEVGSHASTVTEETGFPKYTATTAEFDVKLVQPGDTITYDVTITNGGTLKAVLESLTITATDANDATVTLTGTDGKDAIQYEVTGVSTGTKLAANNGTNTVRVKITYNPDIETQPEDAQLTKKLTVTLNYIQDFSA